MHRVAILASLVTIAACHSGNTQSASPAPSAANASALRAGLQRRIEEVLNRARADSAFPGAFAVVGTHDGVLAEYGVGQLDWAPTPRPDEHTLWDLASLTKVVGLTTAIMQLVEQHRVDLDAPLQRYIPDWTGPNKNRVSVRNLLTHTSGLPAFKAYDEITHDPDSLAKLMFSTPLDTVPGVRMVYSDIGAYMLGKLVERITGETLDAYVHDHVFAPLKMDETMYRPPASLLPRIAPTEFDPKRGGLVRGKVHDERAYYLGGVSAHAGIFSSGHDLARFARMYLNGGTLDGVRVVQASTIARFTAFTDSTFSNRGIGWQKPDLPGMKFASPSSAWAGHLMSTRAFGHTGFTGTSIAIDPSRDLFVVLLTNRVDPTRNNNKISEVRRQLADSVVAEFDRFRSSPH
ncbi:MAG TPA: serine hydrolase domain-containing protein [Gemmatimonadaceae bacterium]|nr:serine hydrolase domain-containing protein [Gemmatimonadaceae bacterium]